MPPQSFQHWYRGASFAVGSASSTSAARGYRGSLGVPVVLFGSTRTEESTGGLTAGGAASSGVVVVATASGGWSAGGEAIPIDPPILAGSFARWYRGTSISNSSSSRSGSFGHVYRGVLTFPVSASVSDSPVAVAAAGGAAFGGAAAVFAGHVPGLSGGLAAGGSGWAASRLAWAAGGGLVRGGSATLAASSHVVATVGLGVGGRARAEATANLSWAGGAATGGVARLPTLGYRVFANDGMGGPIDYSAPVAVTFATTWTSGPLPPGSSFRFGVRAFDAETGLQELNLDASVRLILADDGRDATRVPPAPIGVRAIPLAGGRARIEWTVAGSSADRRASHFHLYLNDPLAPSYSVPTVVVPAASARGAMFAAEVDGLIDGAVYDVVVRSASAAGEDGNTNRVRVKADSTPPNHVDSLTAAPSSTAS